MHAHTFLAAVVAAVVAAAGALASAHAAMAAAAAAPAASPAPAAAAADEQGVKGFYRQPALRGNQVVFVAEGDLWRVALGGGRAERLTTHPGQEAWPALSPDGRWLAFVGTHDGGADAYVMPVAGGVPRRLTWEGSGVRVWGFAATGEVLLTVPARNGHPTTQLQAVDPRTRAQRLLPVAQASDGALSADGKRLYFTRNGLRGDNARSTAAARSRGCGCSSSKGARRPGRSWRSAPTTAARCPTATRAGRSAWPSSPTATGR